MFRRPVKEVNAEYPAEERFLDSIQRTVRDTCVAAGMSRRDAAAVLLAIEEGATNIIRHAYLYDRGNIRIRIVVYANQIVFSLFDTGRSFKPEGGRALDLSKLVESGRKGGLGYYMIQKIMDSTEYISTADFNELRMIKRLDKPRDTALPLISRFSTLRAKFSLFTFLLVLLILGGAFYYVDRRTEALLSERLGQTVKALGKTVADQAAGYIINSRSDVEFDELIFSYLRANPEMRLLVLTDTNRMILAHSEDIRNIRKLLLLPRGIAEQDLGAQPFMQNGQALWYLILPIQSGQRTLGRVHMTYSSARLDQEIGEQRRKVLYLTLAWLGLGIVSIYLLSNYFVTPIARITRRIRRFASGDMETELPLEGAEEFFEISKAFNEMMTRVNQDRRTIAAREKMAKEVEVAAHIQKTLLPGTLPTIPGLSLDARYRSASVVGGDLYDVFPIGSERFCLAVADVSGKGVPASLVMSMLRTVIQIQAQGARSASDIMRNVNRYMEPNIPPGMFVTVLLMVYDSSTAELSVVSAGHTPLLMYRADTSETTLINPPGMPIGMPATLDLSFDQKLEEFVARIAPGDLLLAFTDGVTDCTNREGKQFGLARLTQELSRIMSEATASARDAHAISESLLLTLDRFSGQSVPADDLTYLVGYRTDLVTRAESPISDQEALPPF